MQIRVLILNLSALILGPKFQVNVCREHESWPYIYTSNFLLLTDRTKQTSYPTSWLPLRFLLPMVLMYAILTCHYKLCPIFFISGAVRCVAKAYEVRWFLFVKCQSSWDSSNNYAWRFAKYRSNTEGRHLNVWHLRPSNHDPMLSSMTQLLKWDHNWYSSKVPVLVVFEYLVQAFVFKWFQLLPLGCKLVLVAKLKPRLR